MPTSIRLDLEIERRLEVESRNHKVGAKRSPKD